MNIYILVEVKDRELDSRILLSLIAAERGHTVLIGGEEDTVSLAMSGLLKPGILHQVSVMKGLVRFFKPIKENQHLITSQDEEHGLLSQSYGNFALRRFSKETLEYADKIFCWGEHDKNSLQSIYAEYSSKFIATGSPRVDLWKPEFNSYFPEINNPIVSSYKKYILISSNFGLILNENRFWLTLDMKKKYSVVNESDEYAMYNRAARQFEMLAEFVKAIRLLAVVYPDVLFVLRPHPVEVQHGWKTILREYKNILVLREGSISKWIRNAAALIHNGCTSGFESVISGTPTIAYQPLKSDNANHISNSIDYEAYDENQLVKIVDKVLCESELKQRKVVGDEIIESRFCNLNKTLAADNIVDEWEKLYTNKLDEKNNWVAIKIKIDIPEMLKNIKLFILNLFKIAGNPYKIKKLLDLIEDNGFGTVKFKSKHKFSDLSEKELKNIINRYQLTLNRFYNIKFERFRKKSFIIYK
ncbi:hypothetical protein KA977_05280 [Candidatus Dependentiae bacterium]|nr:hypothetical protein [Candidatus Dependentiae bacterium]